MNPIFKKLQFKNHDKILVLNAPAEFEKNLEEMSGFTSIHDNPAAKGTKAAGLWSGSQRTLLKKPPTSSKKSSGF